MLRKYELKVQLMAIHDGKGMWKSLLDENIRNTSDAGYGNNETIIKIL